MVSSRAYPDLERNPGPGDNWVEKAGGLPTYIERIAKHLHYEKGMTISHAIATAVNTVKRWARKGGVVKYGDPNSKNVTTITAAQAAKAVAEWEAKKASAKARSGGRIGRKSIKLAEGNVDLDRLVERANAIEDPESRGKARQAIIDLAFPPGGPPKSERKRQATKGNALPDGSFPIDDVEQLRKAVLAYGRAKDKAAAKRHIIKRAKALNATGSLPKDWQTTDLSETIDLARKKEKTKDGRKSYDNQGKWKHGFIPVDDKAKQSKAKGSPEARKRVERLYGSKSQRVQASEKAEDRTLARRKKRGSKSEGKDEKMKLRALGGGKSKGTGSTESVSRLGALRNVDVRDSSSSQRAKDKTQPEEGKKGRVNPRATQSWDAIKDSEKITRNGKRYVIANHQGRQILTEWTGPNAGREQTNYDKETQYRSIESHRLEKMSTAELSNLTKNMKQPKSVRSKARKILEKKRKERKKG